jgi:hypothetical protein
MFDSIPTSNAGWIFNRDASDRVASSANFVDDIALLPLFWENQSIPTTVTETVASRFQRLTREWMEDTAFTSSLVKIIESDPHQQIIAMSWSVVPLILEDLLNSPKQWFYALHKITGEDPVPAAAAGNMKRMSRAWVSWGRKKNLIR